MIIKSKDYVPCPYTSISIGNNVKILNDCFARSINGNCGILNNTTFKGNCPFYVPREERKELYELYRMV